MQSLQNIYNMDYCPYAMHAVADHIYRYFFNTSVVNSLGKPYPTIRGGGAGGATQPLELHRHEVSSVANCG